MSKIKIALYKIGRYTVEESQPDVFEIFLDDVSTAERYDDLSVAILRADYLYKRWDADKQKARLLK